ncbi:MAG: D-glycero-alpha-D-manno-heptose-1,7-bisphosphate 7-phosphatase [Gemmatimonadales bacterium]
MGDPAGVRLLPGAGPAVARLNTAGLPVVIVSNQSGIARGLYGREAYDAVEQRVDQLLAAAGARIDGHYFCPHHPEITGPCECRKPGLLLFQQAAERLELDLRRSWWVGDRLSDVRPAARLGGRGILVLTGEGTKEAGQAERDGFWVAPDVAGAVSLILAG